MATTKDIEIVQGKTFSLTLRWETTPIIRKPITAISLASGAPRLTVTGHGMVNGWRGAVTRVVGMKQINAKNSPPKSSDYTPVTVIDADTVELNEVTPCDDNGNEWPAYVSGGFIQYNTPVDLSGQRARMKIKDKVGGTTLASTEAADSPLNILSFDVDNVEKKISLTIAASATDDITWIKGVHELEMVSDDAEPVVVQLLEGRFSVKKEVTT